MYTILVQSNVVVCSPCMYIGIKLIVIETTNILYMFVHIRVYLFVGTSPRLLMLGFMLPTMFLSMWISNTATTAMMVPIVEAVLAEINTENGEILSKDVKKKWKKGDSAQVYVLCNNLTTH